MMTSRAIRAGLSRSPIEGRHPKESPSGHGGAPPRQTGRRRPGFLLFAVFWTLQTAAAPAFAQRRRGEPEANPEFQEQLQGGGGEQPGAPVDPNAGGFQPPPGGAADPVADPGIGGGGRPGAQGVQIGAGAAPPAPPPPSNPLETRVTVRVKDAPLATFLDTISAQAKVNFIITEGVTQRKVTAFLQNVTVREALQILLELKGLTYQQIGRSNTYIVGPRSQNAPNQITRIYVLNHVPLIPLLGAEDGVAGGQGGGGGGGGAAPDAGGGGGGAPAGGQGGAGGGGRGGGGGGGSKIAIINVINSLLSKNGRVSLDPRTNSVVVTDIPEIFPQVEQIIAELDKKVPQVMIEAQVVEINSDRANQLGVSWTGGDGIFGTFTGGSRQTTFPLNSPKTIENTHFFEAGGSAGFPAAAGTLGNLDLSKLTVVLRAIVTRGEGRFLGKPKILTLNNKKATIQITRNETTGVKTQVAGGATPVQAEEPDRSPEPTGVKLEVTPQVNKEGYITLLVEPEFTDVVDSGFRVRAQPVFDPVKRKASTLLRLRNGQTIVLGGLLNSKESRSTTKVPFLGYIPLIGWLFTSTSMKRVNTDLVIFLTPSVVND